MQTTTTDPERIFQAGKNLSILIKTSSQWTHKEFTDTQRVYQTGKNVPSRKEFTDLDRILTKYSSQWTRKQFTDLERIYQRNGYPRIHD